MTDVVAKLDRVDAKAALNAVHNAVVFGRRVKILSQHIAKTIPDGGGRVLDLGCGDGSIARDIMQLRPDLKIQGVDILVRPKTHIPVAEYDGNKIPFKANSFDYVTIVDVLHHTDDPASVLVEAARVAKKGVVIKDHLLEGFLAGPTLRFMDWVGNRGHNVVLPYNYLPRTQWNDVFSHAKIHAETWDEEIGLYPAVASWLFDRRLHFVALMVPNSA